jgi:P-type E1-E2 ATPase
MDENEEQDQDVFETIGAEFVEALPAADARRQFRAPRLWPSLLLALPAIYWSTQLQGWLGYRAVSFPLASFVPDLANLVSLGIFILTAWRSWREISREPVSPNSYQLTAGALIAGYLYAVWLQLSQPIGEVGVNDYHWQLAIAIVVSTIAIRVDRLLTGKTNLAGFDPTVERNIVIGLTAVALSVGFLWGWASQRPLDFAIERGLAILLGCSPIGFVALSRWSTRSAVDLAERLGLRINNPEAFIALRKVALVLFSKTGIITTGQRTFVTSRITRRGGMESAAELMAVAAGLEAQSDHPIGVAIREAAAVQEIEPVEVKDLMVVPGIGVSGRLVEFRLAAGGPALLTTKRIDIDVQDLYAADAENSAGNTVTYISRDDILLGFIATSDETRASSHRAVSIINGLGHNTGLLTGDAHGVTQHLANELGAQEVIAEVLPQDRAAAIGAAQDRIGSIAVVVDADAGREALAVATIGIAVGDVNADPELADIASDNGDPTVASAAVELSHLMGSRLRRARALAVSGNVAITLFTAGFFDGANLNPNTAVAVALSGALVLASAGTATSIRGAK